MVESSALLSQDPGAPRVSVVIACFNCERFIQKAIDSVLAQTISDFEIIVVDDASTDRSCDVVAAYGDTRVLLLRNQTNSGPSHARNVGIAAARGEWVAILDGDDWFDADRLATLISFAELHEADTVADDLHIIFDGELGPRGTWFQEYGVPSRSFWYLNAVDMLVFEIGIVKAIFRRSLVLLGRCRYDESVRYGEDFLMYFSMILGGVKFILYPTPKYYLRRGNTGSLTSNHIALVEGVLNVNLSLLGRADVQVNDALSAALKRRIEGLRSLLRYHSVVSPFRAKQYKSVIVALVRDPGAVAIIAHRVWTFGFRKLGKIAE